MKILITVFLLLLGSYYVYQISKYAKYYSVEGSSSKHKQTLDSLHINMLDSLQHVSKKETLLQKNDSIENRSNNNVRTGVRAARRAFRIRF